MYPPFRLRSVASLAALAVASLTLLGAAKTPPPPAKKTVGTVYKNIKVLKSLPLDQLFPTMEGYNQALGVKCDFCHVLSDYSSDKKKHKLTTRAMILMTNDLNAKQPTVKKQVSCFMCHHGRNEPFRTAQEEQEKSEKANPGETPSE